FSRTHTAATRLDTLSLHDALPILVEALIRARDRGARVRVLLDANKDAFGREKDGVPNRPVAAELHRAGIPVRFASTHGEQFHSKDRKSTRLNSSHVKISYAVFCLK